MYCIHSPSVLINTELLLGLKLRLPSNTIVKRMRGGLSRMRSAPAGLRTEGSIKFSSPKLLQKFRERSIAIHEDECIVNWLPGNVNLIVKNSTRRTLKVSESKNRPFLVTQTVLRIYPFRSIWSIYLNYRHTFCFDIFETVNILSNTLDSAIVH